MPWHELDEDDPKFDDELKECIELGVGTAVEHQKHFGTTAAQKLLSRIDLKKKMKKKVKTVPEPYQSVWYQKSYKGKGGVAVFFQKMKWLSEFINPRRLGDIWVMSLVFEHNPDNDPAKKPIFTGTSTDSEYQEFIDELNDENGPIHTFMGEHPDPLGRPLRSIFTVDPVGSGTGDGTKPISKLDQKARLPATWTSSYGSWQFIGPTKIDAAYAGNYAGLTADEITLAEDKKELMLLHWGFHSGMEFDLTEMRWSP